MLRTRVGYGGGRAKHPTYHDLEDHTESVQLDFDPQVVSYQELLELFWSQVDPTETPYSRQYANLILYHTAAQRDAALASKQAIEARLGQKVTVEVVPMTFHLAEDYHQKYYLRQTPQVAREYTRLYPNLRDFINSTAVTRVNGYLGGHGDAQQLEHDIPLLGLSAEAAKNLRRWHH